jgi:DnaJ-class molecular chaperone
VELILTPDEALRGGRAPIGVPVFYRCDLCGGSGREWDYVCSDCQGQGVVEQEETVSLNIPPGVRSGTFVEIPLSGLGIHNLYLRVYIRIGTPD